MQADNLQIVGITKDTDTLKAELTGEAASPMHYNSPKPQDVLDEDKIVEKFPLHLRAQDVTLVPVGTVFEGPHTPEH